MMSKCHVTYQHLLLWSQFSRSIGLPVLKNSKELNSSRSYREYSWKLIDVEMDKTLEGQASAFPLWVL